MRELKCDLCDSLVGISHLSVTLFAQASLLSGEHLHVCRECKVTYYGEDLVSKLNMLDGTIVRDFLAKER